jgi:hypothetical protein
MKSMPELEAQLIALVTKSHRLMRALAAARALKLSSWCIGAGVVRNLVWDHLHGFEVETPSADLDLVFFDEARVSNEFERQLERTLSVQEPGFKWEVVNQAGVHRWLAGPAGQPVAPFRSLAEGVASWPEVATCVGVSLSEDGRVGVIAPHGLDDLFGMVVRWNPTRVSSAVYAERVAAKRFDLRWPKVRVMATGPAANLPRSP